MDPFSQEESLKDDIIPKDQNNSKGPLVKKIIIFSVIVIAWAVLVTVELIVVFSSKEEEKTLTTTTNITINCLHEIQNAPNEFLLISNNFTTKGKLEIYINDTKADNITKYKPDKNGTYFVKIVLDDPKIDFLFKNVQTLTSIEFDSKNNDKIASMKGVFQNCINLKTVSISGYNTSEVEDMSHMFEGCVN